MNRNCVTIAAGGDTLCRTYNTPTEDDPFRGVHDLFARSDIGFINLESVLTTQADPVARKLVTIRTDPSCAHYLSTHGINMVNLANNHILDYGAAGALETDSTLTDLGIATCGLNGWEPGTSVMTVRDKTVCLMGFHEYELRSGRVVVDSYEHLFGVISPLIRRNARLYDVVIVSMHGGIEHVIRPYYMQRAAAQRFIDDGAKIVLGHHPHVVHGVESYRNGLIAYSLGCLNFTMLGYVRDRWYHKLSYVLQISVGDDGFIAWRQVPIWIDEHGRPTVITDAAQTTWAAQYFDYLNKRRYEYPDPDTQWRSDWDEEAGWEYVPLVAKSFVKTIVKFGTPRLRKFVWWLRQPMTKQAMRGLARSIAKGRTRSYYKPKPPKEFGWT